MHAGSTDVGVLEYLLPFSLFYFDVVHRMLSKQSTIVKGCRWYPVLDEGDSFWKISIEPGWLRYV